LLAILLERRGILHVDVGDQVGGHVFSSPDWTFALIVCVDDARRCERDRIKRAAGGDIRAKIGVADENGL